MASSPTAFRPRQSSNFHDKDTRHLHAVHKRPPPPSVQIPVTFVPPRAETQVPFEVLQITTKSPVGTFIGLHGDKDRAGIDAKPFKRTNGVQGEVAAEDLRLPRERRETAARIRFHRSAFGQLLALSLHRSGTLLTISWTLLCFVHRVALRRLVQVLFKFAVGTAAALSVVSAALEGGGLLEIARDFLSFSSSGASGGRRSLAPSLPLWMGKAYEQTAETRKQVRTDMKRLVRSWEQGVRRQLHHLLDDHPPLVCVWRQGVQVCLRVAETVPHRRPAAPSRPLPSLARLAAAYEDKQQRPAPPSPAPPTSPRPSPS